MSWPLSTPAPPTWCSAPAGRPPGGVAAACPPGQPLPRPPPAPGRGPGADRPRPATGRPPGPARPRHRGPPLRLAAGDGAPGRRRLAVARSASPAPRTAVPRSPARSRAPPTVRDIPGGAGGAGGQHPGDLGLEPGLVLAVAVDLPADPGHAVAVVGAPSGPPGGRRPGARAGPVHGAGRDRQQLMPSPARRRRRPRRSPPRRGERRPCRGSRCGRRSAGAPGRRSGGTPTRRRRRRPPPATGQVVGATTAVRLLGGLGHLDVVAHGRTRLTWISLLVCPWTPVAVGAAQPEALGLVVVGEHVGLQPQPLEVTAGGLDRPGSRPGRAARGSCSRTACRPPASHGHPVLGVGAQGVDPVECGLGPLGRAGASGWRRDDSM